MSWLNGLHSRIEYTFHWHKRIAAINIYQNSFFSHHLNDDSLRSEIQTKW